MTELAPRPLDESVTPHALLTRARTLIDTPKKWTQFAMARRSTSPFPCSYTDDEADRFCIVGSIARARFDLGAPTSVHRIVVRALRRILMERDPSDWVSTLHFNDSAATSHADVLGLVDETLASIAAGRHLTPSPLSSGLLDEAADESLEGSFSR